MQQAEYNFFHYTFADGRNADGTYWYKVQVTRYLTREVHGLTVTCHLRGTAVPGTSRVVTFNDSWKVSLLGKTIFLFNALQF